MSGDEFERAAASEGVEGVARFLAAFEAAGQNDLVEIGICAVETSPDDRRVFLRINGVAAAVAPYLAAKLAEFLALTAQRVPGGGRAGLARGIEAMLAEIEAMGVRH